MGNISPNNAAMVCGAALGTMKSAAAMVGATGASSSIAGVATAAANLPVVGGAVSTGVGLGVAFAPVLVPAAVTAVAVCGVHKFAKWACGAYGIKIN